jgi:hypothetical protein
MAHFAKLDENNIVLEVHVVNNDVLDASNEETSGIAFLTEWSGGYSNWKQTSYTKSFRKNYAGIGYKYDEYWDAFIPPQPFPSWHLDYETFRWVPPVPKPECGFDFDWKWGEINKEWIRVDLNY